MSTVEARVAAVEQLLPSPEVRRRDVVLVTGPWLSGVSSLLGALRERLPDKQFVESSELAPTEAAAAVVFAVSAVAPVTESDCALIDEASRHTHLVIGAVTKIDVHRNWRDVLALDRDALVRRDRRYQRMDWVGVAAAPETGSAVLDELVEVLLARLGDPLTPRRNQLRSWEFRLDHAVGRCQEQAMVDPVADDLLGRRDEILRARRLARSEHTIALRSQLQQARVQLAYFARNRCASVRTELSEDAWEWGGPWRSVWGALGSGGGRARLAEFQTYVRHRAAEVVDEVDAGVTAHLRDVASELGLAAAEPVPPEPPPDLGGPALASRGLETRLVLLLGAGFGLGVALAVSRLFAGLAPSFTAAGVLAGVVAGLLLATWMVGIRGLLQERAVLDRWVGEAIATLRVAVERRVAIGILMAEVAFTGESAARDERAAAAAALEVGCIDARLRAHATAVARTSAHDGRRLPAVHAALGAVRNELYGTERF